MKSDLDIMVDLETLATTPDAMVLIIAGIRFNSKRDYSGVTEPWGLGDYFYARIDVNQPERNLSMDTYDWWMKQDKEIQEEAFGDEGRLSLKDAMVQFNDWAGDAERYWANGAGFDYTILENCNQQLGLQSPWKYWQVCDARTVYTLVPNHHRPAKFKHHALWDCLNQIQRLNDCLYRMNITL
jgi:hypothetical protein